MVKIISGAGSFEAFEKLKSYYSGKCILLVTGKNSYTTCGAEAILHSALKNEKIFKFSDFEVNPKIEDAQRGVTLARDAGVDIIIAVGGGSVIDMAKLIKSFYAKPHLSHKMAQGKVSMSDPNIPLIVAPTTAGSGSEATHFAVVYIGQDKYSVTSQLLLPEIVILDGKLIATGSAYQKACNGLDALAQGIESAWAAGSTDASRACAFEAISLCMNYHSAVVANDKSDVALQGILDGANKAGHAINISKTTAAHAWSYGITNQHGIPHGHAVWLTLPMIFHIHANSDSGKVTDPRGVDHFRSIMDRLMDALSIPSSDQAYEYMKKYVASLGVESEMANVGAATRQQRQLLSEQVNMERMSNNPIYLDGSDKSLIFKL